MIIHDLQARSEHTVTEWSCSCDGFRDDVAGYEHWEPAIQPWHTAVIRTVAPAYREMRQEVVSESETRTLFQRLVRLWQRQTQFQSNSRAIASDPAFLQIVGLGPAVLPLIFEQLRVRAGHWDIALEAITRVNPVPAESSGDMRAIQTAWLKWAGENGYSAADG